MGEDANWKERLQRRPPIGGAAAVIAGAGLALALFGRRSVA